MKFSPFSKKIPKSLQIDWADIALILILCLGIFLRVWKLETHMIFFGDAGRDMLAAVQAIETKTPPLLGIPSSIPRFRQGPVSIWFISLIFLVAGPNPLMVGYLFVLMNVVALLVCFWIVFKSVNIRAALYSTLLLASSPLAVAHSRMPYHITPIVFFLLIYFVALKNLGEKKKKSLFFACLAWALLFQFELALFPLICLIIWTVFRTKQYLTAKKALITQTFFGLFLGLLPQIVYDLTHSFAQLGGFAIWMIYRIVAFLGYKDDHTFSFSRLQDSFSLFLTYFSRIFSYNQRSIGLLMLSVSLMALGYFLVFFKKQTLFTQQVSLGYVLLLLAFVVHGSPSEAYFPPIILLSIIILGSALSYLKHSVQFFGAIFLVTLSLYNTQQTVSQDFFTISDTPFNYGTAYGEKIQVINWINQQSDSQYTIRSTDPDAHFESYLDDYKIIQLYLKDDQISDDQINSSTVYINKKNSELLSLPGSQITFFPTVDVIEITNHEQPQ